MSFPRYPKYKDSGVEWLREVPDNWEVVPLKRIVGVKNGDGITGDSIEETGDYPVLEGNGLRGYTSAFTHDGHFVVIGRQGALCGNVKYATGKFWASEHAVVAAPLKQVKTVWLGEMLRAMNLNQHSVSAAQPGLSMEFISNLRTVLPPIPDQTSIAEFLDRETAKIDELAAEQRRLIELLKEKRQAVISHAVTKGLNPDAPMKPSGIEWLGDVPEHWEVGRLKHVATIRYGIGEPPKYHDDGTPLIRATNIHAGNLFADGMVFVDPSEIAEQRIVWLAAGDIIVVRSGAYTGDSAIIPAGVGPCIAGFDMVLKCHSARSEFIQFALLSKYLKEGQIDLEKMRAAQPHLNAEELGSCIVALPNVQEQDEITTFLKSRSSEFDTLAAEAQRAIDLLQERRTALISAAVTGQIDVRTVLKKDA